MLSNGLAAVALAVAAGFGAASSANALTSHVMAVGMFEPLTITTLSGDVFDLQSLDLAYGPYNPPGIHDSVTLTGVFADSHSESPLTLDLSFGFHSHSINWTGLTSVIFAPLAPATDADGNDLTRYLAFDNLHYSTGPGGSVTSDFEDLPAGTVQANGLDSGGLHYALWFGVVYGPENPIDFPTQVPEPATWGLMILGFSGIGSALRSARRKAAAA